MAAMTKFNCFAQDIGRKVHNLNADVLKFMLSNVLPVVGNTVKANITEIAAGNGYTAGGHALPTNTYVQAAGVAKLDGGSCIITAAGGSIGPARYAVLYNDTAANDELIGWYDYGSSFTLLDGESLTIKPTVLADGYLQVT
jgi:hypothetical protein